MVRRFSVLVATVGVWTLAGCVDVVAFACVDDSQCDRIEGARCFASGCASPDPECSSGFRYAGDAVGAVAGTCVATMGTTTGTSSSTSESSSTGSGESSTTTSGTTVADTSSSSSTDTSSGGSSSTGDGDTDTTGCEPRACTCVDQLSVGNQYNCVVRDDGSVVCWGQNLRSQCGVLDEGQTEISHPTVVDLDGNAAAEVVAHFDHTCARLEDGTVWCWGRNLQGMVDPTTLDEANLAPQPVVGVQDVTALRLGMRSACARHADDTLTCWGVGAYNLLLTEEPGNGPVTSGPYEGLVDFAIGFYHGCLWSTEEVRCWGRNNVGQLAVTPTGGSFAQPQLVALPAAPEHVAVGRNHSCALLDEGTVYCWGYNDTNQIQGEPTATALPPTEVEALWDGAVTRLFALNYHTCVETDAGEVWCWGGTQAGWLGVAGVANNAPLWPPQRIESYDELPSAVASIGIGHNHMCTLLESDEVYCWGNASLWQTGPFAPPAGMDIVRVNPCDAK